VYRGLVALVPLLWLAQGCTVVLSPSEAQCEADADCADRGFEGGICQNAVCVEPTIVDPVWGCLGNVQEPTPDPSQSVSLSIRLSYANGNQDLPPSATIDICDKLDVNCAVDSPDFPKNLHPGSGGIASLTVKQGFDGFVQIRDTSIVDSRVYVGRPLIVAPSITEIQLLRPLDYETLAIVAGDGMMPDPTRGTAILRVADCQDSAVGGVRFEATTADADSIEFYLVGQSPVKPPTATATDADGFGGFFNMPTGPVVAKAFRYEDDVFIGESSFQILADTISYVLIAPTPE
jgi:hypothetical protein